MLTIPLSNHAKTVDAEAAGCRWAGRNEEGMEAGGARENEEGERELLFAIPLPFARNS